MESTRRSSQAGSCGEELAQESAELWEFDSISGSFSSNTATSSDGSVDEEDHSGSSDDEASNIFEGQKSAYAAEHVQYCIKLWPKFDYGLPQPTVHKNIVTRASTVFIYVMRDFLQL